jgi:hypothetical protein
MGYLTKNKNQFNLKIKKRTRIEIGTTPLIKKPKLKLRPIFEIKRNPNQFGIDFLKTNVRN